MTFTTGSNQNADIARLLKDIRTKDYAIGSLDTSGTVKSEYGGTIDANGRQRDIEQLIQIARNSSRKTEETLGLAILITELATHNPKTAVRLWEDKLRSSGPSTMAATIAYWGLWLAYDQLENPIRARDFRARAETLADELSPDESQEYRELTRQTGNAPVVMPEANSGNRQSSEADLRNWLGRNRRLVIGQFGHNFGEFTTNDGRFARIAEGQVRLVDAQLQRGLAKPAIYLLQADPGAGKSHFVREFSKKVLGPEAFKTQYLERNLSAYASIDAAFQDIVLDTLLALSRHKPIVLFVDEVDTTIEERHIFQKLIAPMNGDEFFFQGKMMSLSKQNLLVCFALSATPDTLESKPKWKDFLSRIPTEHRFRLPSLQSPLERVFRALSSLVRYAEKLTTYGGVSKISYQALLFLGFNPWQSARELDQAVEMGVLRTGDPNALLMLEHVVQEASVVKEVETKEKVKIFGAEDFDVEVLPRPR
jgi:hypothetical protein